MKRDLLARSLQTMAAKKSEDSTLAVPAAPSKGGAPKSLQHMSDVLTQVASQAAQDIDVSEITDSDISDRFDVTVGLDPLVESIRNSGQELPVMLRFRRGEGPRYEVVYGRRRIAACRRLGIKVRALVKDMNLREALISQALENSARLERSFIEQAVFATELEKANFSRAEICEALAVDKGSLSRLLSIVRDIPADVINRIGAAHDVGRRPWMELRRLANLDCAPSEEEMLELIPDEAEGAAARVNSLIEALQQLERKASAGERAAKPKSSPAPVAALLPGSPVKYHVGKGKLTIQVSDKQEEEFIEFVKSNLTSLYETWSKQGS
ncbi:plasmid partitioning protein RepB [Leisingera daeponensis]|uniref:plasmid partitioning protein RepB n=1 Tax=Leisingera daeponensis TaxID=405746 RepID=UPI001C989A44|nr:plasmid partitioning protein RepB [Leisingera daeponensis]MBY6058614.1 plasmid partitioning protein RepB [Leisingera daeponensis]